MPGQGVVTIGDKQWSVSIATTISELSQGLSGVPSMPTGTGILFDLGYERGSISVNMSQMLFNLDIVFIGAQSGVVGRCLNVAPGESCVFESVNGARYFLEVNADEAIGVEVGDNVDIEGSVVQPAFWAGLIAAVVALSQVAIVGVGAYRAIKEGK